MKVKKVTGKIENPITYFSEMASGGIIKLVKDRIVEVSDELGYELLSKYPKDVIKVEDEGEEPEFQPKPKIKRRTKLIDKDYQNK